MLVEDILAAGIDDIYCLSVNDAFVMRQVRLQTSDLLIATFNYY